MPGESAFEMCTQLTHRFFYYLDERQYDDLLALMQPDAVWHRQGRELHGHDEVRQALQQRSATQHIRHVVTNGFVDEADAEGATYIAYMIGYRHDDGTVRQPPLTIGGPLRMLLVRTRFVRQDDGRWLIGETSAVPEFEFGQ